MKVTISVWNGWFAQSKSIQAKTPRRSEAAPAHPGNSGGQGRSRLGLAPGGHPGREDRERGVAEGGHHPLGRDDARRIGDRAAEEAGRHRLAAAEHRLAHVEEPGVAADEGRSQLQALERAHPPAVAHRGAGDGQPPAVGAEHAGEPRAHRERHPPEIVERERAAVVELAPGIEVPRPAGVVRHVHARDRQRRQPADQQELEAEAEEGVHPDADPGVAARRPPSLARIARACKDPPTARHGLETGGQLVHNRLCNFPRGRRP